MTNSTKFESVRTLGNQLAHELSEEEMDAVSGGRWVRVPNATACTDCTNAEAADYYMLWVY